MEYEQQRKSWFSRNWPWVVPLGGCLTIIALVVVFLGSVIFGVSSVLTGSDPYKEGLAKAQEDEYLTELLGEPIETNGIMQGSISFKNNTGQADISIPIKGPKAEGKIYVVGTKENDVWTYSKMYVITEDPEETVDLLWGEGKEDTYEEPDF